MNKLFYRFGLYSILLFMILFLIHSCIEQEKENINSVFISKPTKIESSIDFSLIDCLNESNKKTIDLSKITFNNTKDTAKLRLLLKIHKDHQKIDSELKKLVEKNLIIIPILVYNLNINTDSLNKKNTSSYLSHLLEHEIEYQISILSQIEKTSKNMDFKRFAIQSKKMIQTNNDLLKTP